MLWYIRSDCPDNILLAELKRYLQINTYNFNQDINRNIRLKDYIVDNYKLNIKDIMKYIIKNIRISRMIKNFHQIYILDCNINNLRLSSLLSLIEYGNRDISAPKLLSSNINKCIDDVRNNLGGI